MQVTNGMSNSGRSSPLANAGLVVAVSPEEFAAEGFTGPLAGLRVAAQVGAGRLRPRRRRLPGAGTAARRPGWRGARRSSGTSSYRPGLTHADLAQLYPPQVHEALRPRCTASTGGCVASSLPTRSLIGIESRTSAPCRIARGDDFTTPGLAGLYPAGEGAGHAGGIVSSAVDGLKAAEAICRELGG